ncbi:MAG: Hsp20/alpha crystallin family protein [Bacteroidales bacterium]
MFNLKITEDKTMLPTITGRTFRPFHMMDLFDDDFVPMFSGRTTSMPAVNIREDDQKFMLDLAVPGMDKKDLKIDLNKDLLTIASENKNESQESKDGYQRKEFSYSAFCRSFQLPENITRDKIEASYKNGILSITVPKAVEEKNKISRTVEIS